MIHHTAQVTAILINYRDAAGISTAVESLLSNDADLHIVVVDNSADEVCWHQLIDRLPKTSRLSAHRAPGNLGFGAGCNLALEHTSSPYVFFVNPDVTIRPGCVRLLAQALDSAPHVAAVAPKQFLDQRHHWMLPPAWQPTALRAWCHEVALRDPRSQMRLRQASLKENRRFWTSRQPLSQRALSGGALMLRRAASSTSSPVFDPRFFMYFEDSDLCYRLRRAGLTLQMVPNALAIHAWKNEPHKAGMMEKSSQIYFDKHFRDDRWLKKSASWQQRPLQTVALCSFPVDGMMVEGNFTRWLLELSLSPLFQTCIGQLGHNTAIEWPQDIAQNFKGARLYARVSIDRGEDQWVDPVCFAEPSVINHPTSTT